MDINSIFDYDAIARALLAREAGQVCADRLEAHDNAVLALGHTALNDVTAEKGKTVLDFAEIAGDMLKCLAFRGFRIGSLDSVAINIAPSALAREYEQSGFTRFVVDLIKSLCYSDPRDAAIFEALKMSEENPDDPSWLESVDEDLGEIECPEDIEMRTVAGFETYLLAKSFMPVIVGISSWFRAYADVTLAEAIIDKYGL